MGTTQNAAADRRGGVIKRRWPAQATGALATTMGVRATAAAATEHPVAVAFAVQRWQNSACAIGQVVVPLDNVVGYRGGAQASGRRGHRPACGPPARVRVR
jgi:hypothetical protein